MMMVMISCILCVTMRNYKLIVRLIWVMMIRVIVRVMGGGCHRCCWSWALILVDRSDFSVAAAGWMLQCFND